MRARNFLLALAASAALAAIANMGEPRDWLDVLDAPALKSPLASRGLLNGLAQAGPRVVAVGQRGHIVYSDDAGKSWSQAEVPVSSDLVAVTFPTPQAGWAAGHDGVILHSEDAGRTWQRQRDGRPDAAENPLLDIWFEDARTGYAVGAFGLLLRTTDAGAHWESLETAVDNPRHLHLYAVRRIGNEIYIAGEQGLLLKLDRAIERFSAIESPYKGTFFGLTGDARAVLAYGLRGNVVRSADGGRTWQSLNTGVPVGLTASTIDAKGRIVLASQTGHVLASADGGATFAPIKLDRPIPAAAVLATGGTLIVAGPRGTSAVALP